MIFIREQAADPSKVLKKLANIIFLDPQRQNKLLLDMKKRSSFIPITVAENLTWKDFAKISVNLPSLPGIIPQAGLTRHYNEFESYAHVVGYVGPISDKDLDSDKPVDPVLQIPKFQIGKVGVEKKLEKYLRGSAGVSRVEVNASGRVMRELNRTQGKSGGNVHLTIETNLQKFVSERLKGLSASSVLIDIDSGDILSLVSTPSYNPNNFVLGISQSNWDALLNDERKPLLNKAISGAYPPGSTFKMIVAAAALELGLIGLKDKIFCPGFYELGSRKFHCWLKGGHGKLVLKEALQRSCDVYFYEVARKVGIKRIGAMARKLGLGKSYDLPLTGISKGFVPTKAWKKDRFGTSWLVGDTLNVGIGQGFSLATPLQLAIMTARRASGKEVFPSLVKSPGKKLHKINPLPIKKETLLAIKQGMIDVLNDKDGTAYKFRSTDKKFTIAGKTGTSQVRRITREEREEGVIKNEDLPWKMRDHALFTSFAPFNKPKYALSVVVEHGGSGSKVAAPIARDIVISALWRFTTNYSLS